jgi:predicted ATP-grasp superfamily ATP-dependent carboligase
MFGTSRDNLSPTFVRYAWKDIRENNEHERDTIQI